MNARQEIGLRVAVARRAARLSQQTIADSIGIERSAVSDIETGKRNITATELIALAETLNCTVGWLVGEQQDGTQPVRGFRWEEWAVQIHFPGGITTVEHECEQEARHHHRSLLREPVQRSERIEVVRRVNVQGDWISAPDDAEHTTATVPNRPNQERS